MRNISIQRNFLKHPAGSCLVSFGETKVICSASVEEKVPPFLRNSGKGWVTAEYAMLPGSTNTRKRRELNKRDGRSVEIQRLIGRSLRAAVDMDKLGEVSIVLNCDVMQADGGTRTAAITGAWVALYDALRAVARQQGMPSPDHYLLGQIGAVSVGIVDGQVVCDLDYAHDSRAEVDMNVVMRGEDFVEVQGTGEEGCFNRAQMDQLLDAASEGIREIYEAQRRVLEI